MRNPLKTFIDRNIKDNYFTLLRKAFKEKINGYAPLHYHPIRNHYWYDLL